MKFIRVLFFTLMFFTADAAAQERQAGVLGSISVSRNISTSTGYRIGAEVVLPSDRVTGVAGYSIASERKTFLTDSSLSQRLRGELRFHPKRDGLYLSAGANFGYTSNSQYTKTAFNPTAGAGWNFRQRLVVSYAYLFRDQATFDNGQSNKTRGHRVSGDLYYPLNKRWLLRTSVEYTRFRFYQPYGISQGWLNGSAIVVGLGAARRW